LAFSWHFILLAFYFQYILCINFLRIVTYVIIYNLIFFFLTALEQESKPADITTGFLAYLQ